MGVEQIGRDCSPNSVFFVAEMVKGFLEKNKRELTFSF